MGAEAKFEINYSVTQTINLCFDNPHQVIGTLAYILYENTIMYCEALLHSPPTSRKCQLCSGENADSLAFGGNGEDSSSSEGFGEVKNAASRIRPVVESWPSTLASSPVGG